MNNIPMVSILMLTYNHSKYIRQALDSILMQKVDFNYEIIIGDDCSTDDTQDILREYKLLHPEKFKLILRDKNIGATKNCYDIIMRCMGDYIAVLEGDDYWIDENKLKKQVDFLNSNLDYIGSAHKMIMVDENNKQLPQQDYPDCKEQVYTLEHYGQGILPGQSGTLVYRNIYKESKYDYSVFYKAHEIMGDRTLALILTVQGNIYCFHEKMSCYRYVTTHGDSFSAQPKYRNDIESMYKYCSVLSKYCKDELKSNEALKIIEGNFLIVGVQLSKQNGLKPMIILETFKNITNKKYAFTYTVKRIYHFVLRMVKRKFANAK